MPELTLADLIGPAAALVLALGVLYLFYTGRILPRNTVPREDYEALRAINAEYAAAVGQLVKAVKALSTSVNRIAANGKK